MARARTGDLVVVLPGIMGSVLARDGRQLWNSSVAVAGRHALGRLKDLERLALPPGIGDQDPDDGVEAVATLPGLHILPGVSAIDGYSTLLSFLRRRLDFSGGNLIEFPYDWRVSARLSAQRLAQRVEPALAAWRRRSGNPQAKAVFVAHSMGGLVARYYLDLLGGGAHTRSLVTIGTPFRGSVNALSTLNSGVAPRLGPLSTPFTRLARSLPALHQLLPTWRCVVEEEGHRSDLTTVELPGADPALITEALRLHAELASAPASGASYVHHVFGGYRQPTRQTVSLHGPGATYASHRELDGEDHQGDGTVPRFSCFPPHLEDDTTVRYFAQKHGALHNERALLNQLEAILTARAPREFLDGRLELSVDVPEIAESTHCPVEVEADDSRLVLTVTAEDVETGQVTRPRSLRNQGGGCYRADITFPSPGTWRLTVADPAPAGQVRPVTAVVLAAAPWACDTPKM